LALLREKINFVKQLLPVVDSVTKTSEAALKGGAPSESENPLVRAIATVPRGVQVADQKVEQASKKVADVVIEAHARAVQVKTIAKVFFRRPQPRYVSVQTEGAVAAEAGTGEDGTKASREAHEQLVAEQVSHVSSR
jgi:hypothetical protein